MKLKEYYTLTKPGIIFGNLITTAGGFFLASKGNFDPLLFISTLFGTALVIASGCVFNNYIDRKIDAKMERTKNRPIVKDKISAKEALIFGTITGIAGVLVFLIFTNPQVAKIAIAGFILYVAVYGYWKRRSIYGTLIGSFSGAIPPVIGYTAVLGQFDMGTLLLFLVLVVWQIPHFYSIGIYRLNDYRLANLPIFPVVKGIRDTKLHILFYIFLFILSSSLFTVYKLTGFIYLITLILAGVFWFGMGIKGLISSNNKVWSRKMFYCSLLVLLVFSILISIDFYLPF